MAGYSKNIKEIVNNNIFGETYDDMVIIKNIGVDNRCERPIEFLVGKYYAEYLINDKDINLRKSVFGGYIHLLEKTRFPVYVYNG